MMDKRFLVLLLVCNISFGAIIELQPMFEKCYADKKQNCSEENVEGSAWNTTVRFMLFTRKNPEDPELLHMCKGHLPKESTFNPDNRLIVIIPGFLFGMCELVTLPEIKDELLKKGDFNVLIADAIEEYGQDFVESMKNAVKVGNLIAKVLEGMQNKTGFKNENVYLVGHSLGCHTAGIVAQRFKVHRITALDPAGVLYTKNTPTNISLDRTDADLIDVIHTGGGKGIPYLGALFPLGHADFYVNGGTNQPSCSNNVWKSIKKFNFAYALGVSSVPSFCAHAQALEYYKLSINNEHGKFVAWPCSSYKKFKTGNCSMPGTPNVTMGFDFEDTFTEEERKRDFPRKFYLETTSEWPYVSAGVTTKKDEVEPGKKNEIKKLEKLVFFSYKIMS